MSSGYYSGSSPYNFDESEENEKEEHGFTDCILFAIDCNESMLTENTEGDIPVVVALKSVKSTILNKITSKPRDQVGVVLYGTRENNNSAQKDHVFIMCSLDFPDVPRIKEIDSIIEDISLFRELYGSTNQTFPMSDVFSVLSDILSKAPKTSVKRVFLITDNDDPTAGNPIFKKASIQRAKDLCTGNSITLFGLDRPDKKFNTNIFYKDIAAFGEDDEFGSVINTGKLVDLLDMVKINNDKPRSAFRIPFEISPSLTIGIKGYNIIIEETITLPRDFITNAEKISELTTNTTWRCADTEKPLATTDIKLGYEFGEMLVEVSKEDQIKIKTIRDPSLMMLGFRKKNELKEYHQITHPYFIYPDETQYTGSLRPFMALLHTLSKNDQIGICSFVRRVNTVPRIVALVPQAEKKDKEGNQLDPPGFQLIILPYADEIRPIPPVVTPVKVQESARTAAKTLIHKFEDEYDPEKYQNPNIQNHKKAIQNIALGRQNENEKPVDTAIPDLDYIESNLSDEIDAFKKSVGLDNITIEELNDYAVPAKRKSVEDNPLLAKKAKAADLSIPEMWKEDLLSSATNQYLKDYLTTQGIQPKKLKKDLISQVEEHLSKIKQE